MHRVITTTEVSLQSHAQLLSNKAREGESDIFGHFSCIIYIVSHKCATPPPFSLMLSRKGGIFMAKQLCNAQSFLGHTLELRSLL